MVQNRTVLRAWSLTPGLGPSAAGGLQAGGAPGYLLPPPTHPHPLSRRPPTRPGQGKPGALGSQAGSGSSDRSFGFADIQAALWLQELSAHYQMPPWPLANDPHQRNSPSDETYSAHWLRSSQAPTRHAGPRPTCPSPSFPRQGTDTGTRRTQDQRSTRVRGLEASWPAWA